MERGRQDKVRFHCGLDNGLAGLEQGFAAAEFRAVIERVSDLLAEESIGGKCETYGYVDFSMDYPRATRKS